MKVGAPFNPYKVFQGAFAPYWLLEHRGISAGAKLCYIRLLGFAGKDARCYPSLDTLGAGIGVSDRQARDYVKELERAGLITVDQRGLRKTNAYLFLWTAELDHLLGSVPDRPTDPDDRDPGRGAGRDANRNTASALDRNNCSGLDRKNPAALEWNTSSGPIGINSVGNTSAESSSSSACAHSSRAQANEALKELKDERKNRTAQAILKWVAAQGIKRLRSDRRVGLPEKGVLDEWAGIVLGHGNEDASSAEAVLERAVAAANRTGP
jgi:Helix-turn-helix domain